MPNDLTRFNLSQTEMKALSKLSESFTFNFQKFDPNKNSIMIHDDKVIKLAICYAPIGEMVDFLYNFAHLEDLYLFKTKLAQIPQLSRFSQLKKIGLGGNQISKIENINFNTSLEEIELGNNQIHEIPPFEGLPNLKYLNLWGNQISKIQGMENLPTLLSLNLGKNKLTQISGLSTLKNLIELNLSINWISRINGIENLTKLKELSLNGNQIKIIENLGKQIELEEIDLDDNPLDEDFERYSEFPAKYWVNKCSLKENEEQSLIPVISFIGYSKSGKTASIESVIEYLTRMGKKVIALKNLHREGFTIDTPGKNTWRYSQAGAKISVANSPNESALIFNWQLRPMHIIKILYQIGIEDGEFAEEDEVIAILEGFRTVGNIKILCVKEFEDIQDQLDPSVKYFSGQISVRDLEKTKTERKYNLPIINLVKNPECIDEILQEL